MLSDPVDPISHQLVADHLNAAKALALEFQSLEVPNVAVLENALSLLVAHKDGIAVAPQFDISNYWDRIGKIAIRQRLPTIANSDLAVSGIGNLLMSYGIDYPVLWRRDVQYAGKILKGSNPADMPIERPTRFKLVVSLHFANAIGVSISPTLLATADEVIE